jgi:hypothetical protein
MDHTVLVVIAGGAIGGIFGLLLVFLAGWIELALNAREFSELT